MQLSALALLVLAPAIAPTSVAVQLVEDHRETPVARVVELLGELKAKIHSDGMSEQKSYDQYACWCEDTLGRKAGDISKAKLQITDLETLLVGLKGEIASHGGEIDNVNKAIVDNRESQRDANDVRERESEEYSAEKMESEQCIGALEAAIKVLTGAGAQKKGFLETLQEAQLLGVVAGIRGVLRHPAAARAASDADLQVVKRFVERPQDFVGGAASVISAVQVKQNPFGDYAPQSTQIQGILRGMYEAFTADLEKANAEESEQQKAFEQLMATKKAERATLQATLERHTLEKATKTKKAAESQQLSDDTKAQLDADQTFFGETKAACQSKAHEWSSRTRLRTEELQGIEKAIEILSKSSSVQTFTNATTSFLQLPKAAKHRDLKLIALKKMRSFAAASGSVNVRKLASLLQAGGHFDKVIEAIDLMIAVLRKEEQEDIVHRDRCQGQVNKNTNDMEDLTNANASAGQALERMENTKKDLEMKISELESAIAATKADLEEILKLRNEEYQRHVQSLKDDTDAVALLEMAIVSLTKFYQRNKIQLDFVQKDAPEYTVDNDKAPETSWKGADYTGRSSESSGIIAILSMIKEDLEMEMKTARSDDSSAEKEYEVQRSALKSTLDKQLATKTETEMGLADLEQAIADTTRSQSETQKDLEGADQMANALKLDCSWVDAHFETRRDKRKTELAGLVDAKNYLAGVEAGDEV